MHMIEEKLKKRPIQISTKRNALAVLIHPYWFIMLYHQTLMV